MPANWEINVSQLLEKIKSKKAHVVVIGIGYVGLPLVVELAKAGYRVTGYDKDPTKVKHLTNGVSYIEDIHAEEFAPHIKSGLMDATTDEAVIKKADCVVMCVPTPLKKSKDPDMSYIESAAQTVARHQHAAEGPWHAQDASCNDRRQGDPSDARPTKRFSAHGASLAMQQ